MQHLNIKSKFYLLNDKFLLVPWTNKMSAILCYYLNKIFNVYQSYLVISMIIYKMS